MRSSITLGIFLSSLPLLIAADGGSAGGQSSKKKCVEPKLHVGSTTESAGTNSCHCGYFFTSDFLTCPDYKIVEPDTYKCDGPEDELSDCKLGTPLPVTKETVKCEEIAGGGSVGIPGTNLKISISLPVCVGTHCVTQGSSILSYKQNAYEVECNSEDSR